MQTALISMAILFGLMSVGCGPKRAQYALNVKLDDTLRERFASGAGVRVHMVGVQEGDELARLKAKSVDGWFSAKDAEREAYEKEAAIKELLLGKDESATIVTRSDEIWSTWKTRGAKYIVILVNLPGKGSKGGGLDSRMLILPIMDDKWQDKPRSVQLNVREGKITVTPPPLPL